MDIKSIRIKHITALVICFCITVICANIDNKDFYMNYIINKDFYKSYEYESVLYEIATNSVYTVVGDNASEKMLNNRDETRKYISNYTSAQIFVVNNDSKEVYSNNIFELDKYLKAVKNYAEIYEINFKQNVMYRLQDNEKVRVSTSHFGNLAQTRKEDVTTYIAIPYYYEIGYYEDTNKNEPLYVQYLHFKNNTQDALIFVGSKTLAAIVLLGCIGLYLLNNIDKDKKNIINNLLKNISLFALAFIFSWLFSMGYGRSNLYLVVNTILLYTSYSIGIKLLEYKREGILFEKVPLFKTLYEFKIKDVRISASIKRLWSIIIILIVQLLLFSAYTYMIDGWYDDYVYVIMWILIIGLSILLLCIIGSKVNSIEKIKSGIKEIKKGNLDYKINLKKDSILDELVSDINEIGESINIAVEERVKSERMKNELITNVSHDLKTPLTAMINYISLMKNEDIQPEYIKDYVQVLDKRSQRLKVLIEDLFEASKIGSSNIELELEETDINQLLTQTLVEMEEYIEESKLDFIVKVPEHEVHILADGKRTFRVFENIVSNIVKYSLEGTRVYIDLEEKDGKVSISFKNVSKHQLNFDPDEITERFTRGDLSRNTEGSGLGLAIAKGLVEAQGGSLKVDIIGDLFIVNIEFFLE
ncbi:MAG: sensor histidine kinase [Peptostreptococcaceae bacterium]